MVCSVAQALIVYWPMNKQTLLSWRRARLNNCHADDELKMLSEPAKGLRSLHKQRQGPYLRKDYTSGQSERVFSSSPRQQQRPQHIVNKHTSQTRPLWQERNVHAEAFTWPNRLLNLSTPSSITLTSRPKALLSLRNLASRAKGSGCAAGSAPVAKLHVLSKGQKKRCSA